MANILWAIIGQSNETDSFPEIASTVSATVTGSTTVFTVDNPEDYKVNDSARIYNTGGGDLVPSPPASSFLVLSINGNDIELDYTSSSGSASYLVNQSGRIASTVGLPNSGAFWAKTASDYTAATGDRVQVSPYGVGGTSFIDGFCTWNGSAVTGVSSLITDAVDDINSRMDTFNSITPYDELWVIFQHGQADADPGFAPYTSTGAISDSAQAGHYSDALQEMVNYINANVNTLPSKIYIGSSIPTAGWGNNDAMDNVIEAGINDALTQLPSAEVGPMMHALVASEWSVTTYPSNWALVGDSHAIRETQEFMATAYGQFLGIGSSTSPTLTTPYSIGTNNGPLFTIKTSDTLSTIEGAGFFDGNAAYASLLKTGDVLLIEASNGTKLYNVTVEKISRTITLSSGTEIV